MLVAMSENQAVELQVFVEAGCQTCERALELLREVEHDFPQLAVRTVDVSESPSHRDDVFAVPTFLLNGRLLSLGNPQRSDLRGEIESLLRGRGLL